MLDGHNLRKKALAYLQMNVDFYPNYSKSYVAMGNYYLSQKDKPEAISYYKKAIEIDGNKEAKIKLEELGN
jgi:tetratricopeptide (TPR) repeat protein